MSVILIPASPAAPEDIKFVIVRPSAMVRSPFTGKTQVTDWGNSWLEATVTMPPLTPAQAQNWIAFLDALKGQVNTFQFGSAFASAYAWAVAGSTPLASLYWRLKGSSSEYSVTKQRVCGLSFEIVQEVS